MSAFSAEIQKHAARKRSDAGSGRCARSGLLCNLLGGALYRRGPPSPKRSPERFVRFPLSELLTIGEFRALRSATRAPPSTRELLKKAYVSKLTYQNFCEAANRRRSARPDKKGCRLLCQHPLTIHNGVWGYAPSMVWGGAPFRIHREAIPYHFTASKACAMSAMMSSTFSSPTDRRIMPALMPAATSCSSVS